METELLQLAREAVAALQTGPPPNWAEGAGLFVSAAVGFGQIGLIAWVLRQRDNGPHKESRLVFEQNYDRESCGSFHDCKTHSTEVLTQTSLSL